MTVKAVERACNVLLCIIYSVRGQPQRTSTEIADQPEHQPDSLKTQLKLEVFFKIMEAISTGIKTK